MPGLLDPAFLDPEQRPAIGRIILASVRSKLELPYWIFAVIVSGWLAWRGFVRDTLPYLPCEDGHCPDPGTREYLGALGKMHQYALDYALAGFAASLILAVMLRVAALAFGSLLVGFFGDIRASPDGDPESPSNRRWPDDRADYSPRVAQ